MTQGIEFLEIIYGQLHEAGIVRSKGDFSERLLGKSPSYLTSMRAKQRVVSSSVVMGLGDNLMVEMRRLGVANHDAELQSKLRRAMAQVNIYLANSHMPSGLVDVDIVGPPPVRKFIRIAMDWIGALLASGIR